jgi:replicative DNA helicase
MDEEEIGLRMACARAYDTASQTGPVYFDAMRDALSEEDKDDLHLIAGHISELPFFFDDRTGLTPGQIVPGAKRLIRQWEKKRIEPGLIIVDHLHLVKPDGERYGNRAAEIGDASGALRDLAKETGVAVLTLCQINRGVEARDNKDKRPTLADLKGSGTIEEDADKVIFLYRPEYYLTEPENKNDDTAMMKYMDESREWKDKIQWCLRKNRSGPSNKDHTMKISLPHNALWEEGS